MSSGSSASLSPNLARQLWPPSFGTSQLLFQLPKYLFGLENWAFIPFLLIQVYTLHFSVQGQFLVAGPGQKKSTEGVSLTVRLQFDMYRMYRMYIFITGMFLGDSTSSMQWGFIFLCSFAHGDIWFCFCFVVVEWDQIQLQYLKARLGLILVSLERVKLVNLTCSAQKWH